MPWNHRVISTDGAGERIFGVHEAYYDLPGQSRPSTWTVRPVEVQASDARWLAWTLAAMVVSLAKPVLKDQDDDSERTVLDDMPDYTRAMVEELIDCARRVERHITESAS